MKFITEKIESIKSELKFQNEWIYELEQKVRAIEKETSENMMKTRELRIENTELRRENEKLNQTIEALNEEIENAKKRSNDEIKNAFQIAFSGLCVLDMKTDLHGGFGTSTAEIRLAGRNGDLSDFVRDLLKRNEE